MISMSRDKPHNMIEDMTGGKRAGAEHDGDMMSLINWFSI